MTNLKIQFNANIIRQAKELELSVDYLGSIIFILLALEEKRYDLLDEFDDNNKERRAIILYRHMQRKGLLKPLASNEKYYFSLSKKGKDFLEYMQNEFEKDLHIEVVAETFEPQLKKEVVAKYDINEWIKDYIEIFPTGSFGGRVLRTHPSMCIDRMTEFIDKYKYDKDTILGATKFYIKEQNQSASGHDFTRNSTYFISKGAGKDKISDLATYCKKYIDEKDSIQKDRDTSVMDLI